MSVGRACEPGEGSGNLGLLPPYLSTYPPSLPRVPETIQVEVRTSTASGLLLWQGMVSVGVQQGSGKEKGGGHTVRGLSSPAWGPQTPCASLAGDGRGQPREGLHQSRPSGWAPRLQVGSFPSLAPPPPAPPRHPIASCLLSSRLLPQGAAAPSVTPTLLHPLLSCPPHPFLGLCDRSYQLGSGEARLVSEDPINDGEWHRVTALR